MLSSARCVCPLCQPSVLVLPHYPWVLQKSCITLSHWSSVGTCGGANARTQLEAAAVLPVRLQRTCLLLRGQISGMLLSSSSFSGSAAVCCVAVPRRRSFWSQPCPLSQKNFTSFWVRVYDWLKRGNFCGILMPFSELAISSQVLHMKCHTSVGFIYFTLLWGDNY